jgi:hypothetical protein
VCEAIFNAARKARVVIDDDDDFERALCLPFTRRDCVDKKSPPRLGVRADND